MEIINKASDEYKHNDLRTGIPAISISKDFESIFISKKACTLYELESGQRAHFVYEFDRLYFFVNYDDTGIPITKAAKERGFRLRSPALIKTLHDKYPSKIRPEAAFKLRACVTKINDATTIEVLLNTKP